MLSARLFRVTRKTFARHEGIPSLLSGGHALISTSAIAHAFGLKNQLGQPQPVSTFREPTDDYSTALQSSVHPLSNLPAKPHTWLFLGNLPHSIVTPPRIRELLAKYGEIKTVRIPDTHSRPNFAYVEFPDHDACVAAYSDLQMSPLIFTTHLVKVDFARPPNPAPPKPGQWLFLGGLPPQALDQKYLLDAFQKYGKVLLVKIAVTHLQFNSHFAHIRFAEIKACVSAYEDLKQQRFVLDGRRIRVFYGRAKMPVAPNHVLFIRSFNGTKAELESVFAKYKGRLSAVHFGPMIRHLQPDDRVTFGFLEFNSIKAATAALNAMNRKVTEWGTLQLEYHDPTRPNQKLWAERQKLKDYYKQVVERR